MEHRFAVGVGSSMTISPNAIDAKALSFVLFYFVFPTAAVDAVDTIRTFDRVNFLFSNVGVAVHSSEINHDLIPSTGSRISHLISD
jgi:hypothetical protein